VCVYGERMRKCKHVNFHQQEIYQSVDGESGDGFGYCSDCKKMIKVRKIKGIWGFLRKDEEEI